MNKKYFSTAIPYVNAAPHVGFALEAAQADSITRYYRLRGDDVYFSSGTDENSLKNVQAAEAEGIPVRELVDKYAKSFKKLQPALNLTYDVFNRTANDRHIKGAQKLWLACKKEDIYKKDYTGLYCVGCEEFYAENELVDGKCPEHKVAPEKVSEENYFFKLSNYQQQLEDLIQKDRVKIIPETRKNEVLSFIKQGLKDFSISRSVERAKGWGVPVPNDNKHVMFVWFDALTTYLTALGYGTNEELFKKYWTEDTEKAHIIGKGIIRFHAVYWIAMLLSAGLSLPNTEFVHGYVTVNGQKISKSLGNIIDPFELVKKYGTDAVRYYLLREIPSYGDGDFSEERFKEIYNGDLANGLGNLVARIAKLAEKCSYVVSQNQAEKQHNADDYHDALKAFNFSTAIAIAHHYVRDHDIKLNQEKPWEIADNNLLKQGLTYYIEGIIATAKLFQPFLPQTSEKILKQFSGEIKSQASLFPRL